MSEQHTPAPCPFCGETGVTVKEGSTFRWLVAECDNCGARCTQVRKQTLGEGTPADWQKAGEAAAIIEWNSRVGGKHIEQQHDDLQARLDRLLVSVDAAANWIRNCSTPLDAVCELEMAATKARGK